MSSPTQSTSRATQVQVGSVSATITRYLRRHRRRDCWTVLPRRSLRPRRQREHQSQVSPRVAAGARAVHPCGHYRQWGSTAQGALPRSRTKTPTPTTAKARSRRPQLRDTDWSARCGRHTPAEQRAEHVAPPQPHSSQSRPPVRPIPSRRIHPIPTPPHALPPRDLGPVHQTTSRSAPFHSASHTVSPNDDDFANLL